MKKTIIILFAMLIGINAMAYQRAFYVKKGNDIAKYNFGVASDLKFSNNGRTLTVTGYSESINLDEIDYITFNPPMSEIGMTPDAQKQKMIEIGEEINKRADLKKVEELMKMLHVYTSYHTYDDDTHHYPSVEFQFPPEFWNVHDMIEITEDLLDLSTGNPAATRSLAAKTVPLYKASDFYGIYVADEETETWKKTDNADFLEIRFMSQDNKNYYSARLTCSADYTTWTTSDFVTRAPKTMTLELIFKNEVLAKSVITTNLVQGNQISLNLLSESNGYKVNTDIAIYNDSITEHDYITVDGEYFLESNTKIDGKDLLKYEVMKPVFKDCFEQELDNGDYKEGDLSGLFAQFYRAHSKIDVLKMLQTDGRIYEFGLLYDKLKDDSDDDDYGSSIIYLSDDGEYIYTSFDESAVWDKDRNIIICDDSKESKVADGVKHLGDYTDIKFFYDGKKTMQGFLSWEPNEEVDDQPAWYDEYNDIKLSGFTVFHNRIITVRRSLDYIWDEKTQEAKQVLTPWFIEVYKDYNDDPDFDFQAYPKKIEVAEENVFFPDIIRYINHNANPVLIFPDMTIFAFGDYFTNTSFTRLIDDYNDLINLFKEICNVKDEDWNDGGYDKGFDGGE